MGSGDRTGMRLPTVQLLPTAGREPDRERLSIIATFVWGDGSACGSTTGHFDARQGPCRPSLEAQSPETEPASSRVPTVWEASSSSGSVRLSPAIGRWPNRAFLSPCLRDGVPLRLCRVRVSWCDIPESSYQCSVLFRRSTVAVILTTADSNCGFGQQLCMYSS